MGGNAIKSIELTRLNRVDYDSIEKEIKQLFNKLHIYTIPFYHTKESFGDMDLVVEKSKFLMESNDKPIDYIKSVCGSREVFLNNDYISFEYKNFQIDFLLTPADEINSAVQYYAFNDRSNLVGRIAHKMGFKFGHTGVYFIHRDGDKVLKEILVTRDLIEFQKNVLDIEYKPETYNTLEDIFNGIIKSKFFDPVVYQFDNLNAVARIRDKKRPTYNKFLKFIEDKPSNHKFDKTKSVYYYGILKQYGKLQELLDANTVALENSIIKSLVGGETLMQFTVKRGKELGQLKTKIMENLTREKLLTMSTDDVKMLVQGVENVTN